MKIDFQFPESARGPSRMQPSDICPRQGEELSFGEDRYRVASVSWQNDGPGKVPTAATIHLEAVDPN